ncbi:MAG: DUF2723 domain-containing protein [Acidobacteria bacterium]|nr:DUF2723 domain-containing protein [Acidobacteriota bacterium]
MGQSKRYFESGGDVSVAQAAIPSLAGVESRSETTAIPRIYALLLVAFLVLSRWFVAPAYLYYFDSANFALALENFNPALHQPQPPGYPLFVALTRLIDVVLDDPQQIMLVAGLIGGIAAVLVLLYLGTLMFGRAAGILAAALLASDPVFWFGGVTNEVRIFLALGMAAICLLGWRALTAPERPGRLYVLFAAIGIAAGFRPIETWLLMPLALWIWYRTGRSVSRLLIAHAALAATTLPWLAVVVWSSGGPAAFFHIVNEYANSQFHDTSALYGAHPPAAWHMALEALGWTALGALVWIWAVPFVRRTSLRGGWRTPAAFLALALLPPLVFSAVVHVGDPDQTLASVTVLSLIGGALLSRLLAGFDSSRVYAAAALVAVAHISSFYRPPFHLAEAASYGAVRNVDRMTTAAIRAIDSLKRDGPVTIVHYGSPVTFRQVEYYFSDDYVVALPGSPVQRARGSTFTYFQHRSVAVPAGAAGKIGPGTRRLICLVPGNTPDGLLPGWHRYGPVFVLDKPPQSEVNIGEFRLIW